MPQMLRRRRMPSWWWKAVVVPLAVLAVVEGCGTILGVSPWAALEGVSFDVRSAVCDSARGPSPVSIVVMDEKTDSRLRGRRRPRTLYGRALKNLRRLGAKVVGFDLLFDDVEGVAEEEQQHDHAFADELWSSGNCVLASRLFRDDDRGVSGFAGAIETLRCAAASDGIINVGVSSSGVVRELPLYRSHPALGWKRPVASFSCAVFLEILAQRAWDGLPSKRRSALLDLRPAWQAFIDEVVDGDGPAPFLKCEQLPLEGWRRLVAELGRLKLVGSERQSSFDDPVLELLFRRALARRYIACMTSSLSFRARWPGDYATSARKFASSGPIIDGIVSAIGALTTIETPSRSLSGPDYIVDFASAKGIGTISLLDAVLATEFLARRQNPIIDFEEEGTS